MADIKQLERNMQNTHALKEHSSYCECIWCLEKDSQQESIPDLAKLEVEQEMASMLRDLPLSITIEKEDDLVSGDYTWQFMGTTGKADSFVDATRQALQAFIHVAH